MDYQNKKVVELREIAKKKGLKGYSKLLKKELIDLLEKTVQKVKKPLHRIFGTKTPSLSPFLDELSPFREQKIKERKQHVSSSVPMGYQKLYEKNIFLTPSLAFIYQIANDENLPYIPKHYNPPLFIFTYEDAKECCLNINSPQWNKVKEYLILFRKNFTNWVKTPEENIYVFSKLILDHPLDVDFFLDILKKEALEFQKGNLTLLHSKDIRYLVLDILAQLTSGTYEGFRQKCQRKNNLTAIENITSLFIQPKISVLPDKDHIPEIRKRIQSCNTTIFNNAFDRGESTVVFFYSGSVLEPQELLETFHSGKNKMSKQQIDFITAWMDEIKKIGENCMQLYSFPMEVYAKYVYPSKSYGNIHDQSDIILNYQSYTTKKPWKDRFEFQIHKQMRIYDLCYTKFAYKDGVRFYQLTNIPLEELELFIEDLSEELKTNKELNDWFVEFVDIPEQKEKKRKPTRRILSYRSKKFFEESETISREQPEKEEWVELVVKGDKKGKGEKELVILPKEKSPKPAVDTSVKKVDLSKKKEMDYSSKKVIELKQLAKERGLKGYSKLLKAELIQLLSK